MSRSRQPGLLVVLPLYLVLAAAMGFVDYHVRRQPDLGFTVYAPSVLAGQEAPPGRYRVLAPYAYTALTRLSGLSPLYGWLFFRWLCLVAALLAGHVYFRTWFDTGAAVAGNVLMMAMLPLTFTNGWPNPDQFTELFLFTCGCACVARGWTWGFLAVLALNAVNRETSAFLLPLFALAAPPTRTRVGWAIAAAAVWLAIFLGLRVWLGFVPYNPWQLAENIGRLTPLPANFAGYYRIYGWFFLLLLAPLFWLSAWSWRAQPQVLRVATALVAPVFLVTGFLFSSVIESRIFTPMLPLLLPGVLWTLFERRT